MSRRPGVAAPGRSHPAGPLAPACPDCRHAGCRRIGRSLSFGRFAGGALVSGRGESPGIYRCAGCCLVFKHPRPDDDAAGLARYNDADGSVWQSDIPRPEFDVAEQVVLRHGDAGRPARVLDVGCNQGSFLGRLPTPAGRFGVEVNRRAAARAQRIGVQVWPTLSAIPSGEHFDVVTCFDVIEHVNAPAAFLHDLLAKLKPGGRLVLSSGDAAAFMAERRPAVNWYFANPEHLSFVSAQWLEQALQALAGCRLESQLPFLHGRVRRGTVATLQVAAFKLWPRGYLAVYARLKAVLTPNTGVYVPGNGLRQDHRCYVVQKSHHAG